MAPRGNLQNMASPEMLNITRAWLVLLVEACSRAKVYNKQIKLSKDSSLDSGETIVLQEFWEGNLGGPHLLQSGAPRAF